MKTTLLIWPVVVVVCVFAFYTDDLISNPNEVLSYKCFNRTIKTKRGRVGILFNYSFDLIPTKA